MTKIVFAVSFGLKWWGATQSLLSTLHCGEGNYLIHDKFGKIFCVTCPDCLPGMQPGSKCDNTTVYPDMIELECIFCPDGYFSEKDHVLPCQLRKSCFSWKVITECGQHHDRECGGCKNRKYNEALDTCELLTTTKIAYIKSEKEEIKNKVKGDEE